MAMDDSSWSSSSSSSSSSPSSDSSFPTMAITRALGMVEESWTKGTSCGTGITVLAALFNTAIHGHLILCAIQKLLDSHPLLRSHIFETSKSKHSIHSPSSSSASKHVQQMPWPSLVHDFSGVLIFPDDLHDKHGSLALHSVVNDELNFNFLNPDGNPSAPLRVFHVNFYPNLERQQTVIALRFHGGIFDRQSSSVISQDFFATLASHVNVNGMAANSKPTAREMESSADDGILPAVEDLIPKAKASRSIWQKSVEAVAYAVYAKIYSLLPFHSGFSAASSSSSWIRRPPPLRSNFVSLNFGKHATTSLFDACKQHNISPSAALSAAFLKTVAALKELKKKKLDEFSYMCILDCRDRLEPKLGESALGNYSLGIPQHEKVKEGIDFWEYARQIDASVKKDIAKSKHFTELPVLGFLFSYVMKHPYLTPSSSMRTALMAVSAGSAKNEMKPRRWKGGENSKEGGLEMVGTLGPLASMHYVGPCFFVAETVLEGPELVMSVVYPTPVYGRDQILQLLNASADVLRFASYSDRHN